MSTKFLIRILDVFFKQATSTHCSWKKAVGKLQCQRDLFCDDIITPSHIKLPIRGTLMQANEHIFYSPD